MTILTVKIVSLKYTGLLTASRAEFSRLNVTNFNCYYDDDDDDDDDDYYYYYYYY